MTQEITRSSSSAAPPASSPGSPLPAGVRTMGMRACPSCGASVNVNATVCAACGERMPVQNRTIRCRRCRGRANASLVVCPHCGRELHPARPLWLIAGAPLALIMLLGLFFMARSNPVAWAQARVASLGAVMSDISTQLDPEVNIVFVPPDTDIEDPLASQAALSATTPTTVGEGNPPATEPAAPAVEVVSPAADTPAPTDTPTPPQDAAPVLELSTPTALPNTYRVERGDTVFEIALRYGLTEDELLAANNLTARDAFTLQPGQELIIPLEETATPAETPTETPAAAPSATPTATAPAAATATATVAATALPSPTALLSPPALPSPAALATATPGAVQIYTVRAGDTLAAIAIRNSVTIDSILAANNLTLAEGRQLRAGQQLTLPVRAALPGSLLPTATPVASDATVRLAAPRLRDPAAGATLSCENNITLAWEPAPEIRVDDLYVVHLGYVDVDGAVVWVAQPQRAANVIAWEVDAALCDLPPATASGEWRWWVEVVADAAAQPVSPPSETRSFVWR